MATVVTKHEMLIIIVMGRSNLGRYMRRLAMQSLHTKIGHQE